MSEPQVDVEILGEGRDLVLLHSLLSVRTSFEPLAARIAGERRLILVNLPGFGRSPPAGPALGDYADAIAAMFDDLALPPTTDVLGNGLGGKVEENGMGAVVDAAMRRMFPHEFIAANPEIVAGREAVFRRIDPGVFAAACRALAALDLSADLARIRNPTLIVVGARDEATPPAL